MVHHSHHQKRNQSGLFRGGHWSGKQRALRVMPKDHQLGMKVPKGGSMCANCRFLAAPTECGNKGFIEWNGGRELPEPAHQYCCDLYGPRRNRADGGAVNDDLSDADMAAMMPETYVNPLVKQKMDRLISLPQRAIGAAQQYTDTGEYNPAPILESATLPMQGTAFSGARAGEALGAGPMFPNKAAARIELNRSQRVVDNFMAKQREWQNGGPRPSQAERAKAMEAFKSLDRAKQHLVTEQPIDMDNPGLPAPDEGFAGGGRVHMADGGVPAFDETRGPDVSGPPPFDEARGPDKQPSSGLSSYIPQAISDIPHEAYEATANQVRNIGNAWSEMRARRAAQAEKDAGPSGSFFDPSGLVGTLKDVGSTGKALISAASIPVAPIQGAAESLIGHPLAQAEHIVGTIINPQQAAKDDPTKMYETAKQDVTTALSAARPRGFTATGPIAPPATVAPEALANTAAADEFGIRLSRGQATQDLDTIRYEDMAARGAYGPDAQKRAAEFFNQQFADTQAGGQAVGQQTARTAPVVDNPAEAATAVGSEVADRAARARALQASVEQRAAAEAEAQRGIVSDQQRALNDAIRGGALPVEGPREAGEIVGQNVREAAEANRREFKGLYREFGQLPGEFDPKAVRGLGVRIGEDLATRDEPVLIDEQLTPSASKALKVLDDISKAHTSRPTAPAIAKAPEDGGIDLRGIDQMRKKLVAYYQSARANPTDARAMRAILDGFDNQIERAISDGLFSGDPRALQALQDARASYSRYRQLFTPRGSGDDVGTAMRRIVERGATPEETANMIIGSGKIGNAGLPVRIADRLERVLGADSDSWSAIRQAMWQKASQVRNAAGELDPVRSANSINDFTSSSLAQRMFTNQERAAMRSHAQGVRDLERNIEQLPATQTVNRVREAYQDTFGGADLGGGPATVFRRMVTGDATPEEITNGVFKIIGSGNPGHVARTLHAIERIVGPDSEAMAAVRQGVWQKLTQAAAGKDQPGAQKAMQAINEFLNGSGRTIAQQLYSPQELALMDRYQKVLKLTIIPKYARTNSDTAPAMLAAVRKYAGMIGSALGFAAEHGSPSGGLSGYAVGKLLDKAGEKFLAARQGKKLNDTFSTIVPPPVRPAPSVRLKSARVLPLSVSNWPTQNIGAAIASMQGPVPASADQKKH